MLEYFIAADIADIRFCNQALDASEVRALY
jgi:hypothetical protein